MPVQRSRVVNVTLVPGLPKLGSLKSSGLVELLDNGFINPKTNRKLTKFQVEVYRLCAQIPEGSISTYGAIAKKLNSSPRAVGQALKINPFAPNPVPCHRVIASTGFIGGFEGQWGQGIKIDKKHQLLIKEGIFPKPSQYVSSDSKVVVGGCNDQDELDTSKNLGLTTFKSKMFLNFKV